MKNKTAEQIHPNQTDIFDLMGADNGIHSKSIITEPKYKLIAYDVPFSYRLPSTVPLEEAFFETFEHAYKYSLAQDNLDIEIHHTEHGLLTSFHV